MIAGVHITKSASLAAAVAPMGARVKLQVTEDHHLDKFLVEYHISLVGKPRGQNGSRNWVWELLKRAKSGELERVDPTNPLLDGLRAIANLKALEEWRELGVSCRLFSAEGTMARTIYRPAAAPEVAPGKPGVSFVRSADIRLAAALGVVGCPVVGLDGDRWTIAGGIMNLSGVTSEFFKGPVGKYQEVVDQYTIRPRPEALVAGLRDGTLAREVPDHPLNYAYRAARVYLTLLGQRDKAARLVALKKPNSVRCAIVSEAITGKGMDRLARFFGEE